MVGGICAGLVRIRTSAPTHPPVFSLVMSLVSPDGRASGFPSFSGGVRPGSVLITISGEVGDCWKVPLLTFRWKMLF